jgi:hypothetical protein
VGWDHRFCSRLPMESSSIFGAEKMEPNDFENNERALVALRDDDAAAFCTLTL